MRANKGTVGHGYVVVHVACRLEKHRHRWRAGIERNRIKVEVRGENEGHGSLRVDACAFHTAGRRRGALIVRVGSPFELKFTKFQVIGGERHAIYSPLVTTARLINGVRDVSGH